MSAAKDPIIVALDFPTEKEALQCVDRLGESASFYKVGLQLYTAAGPEIVRKLHENDLKVFLDLKCHDIPNTVAGAVRSAAALGVNMLTIHATGGREMIQAAQTAASESELRLFGVTVLTSMDAKTLSELAGQDVQPSDQVLRLAALAADCKLPGLVCSPLEVSILRQLFGRKFELITPGVRPEWATADDQQRIMTPAKALELGADWLVVGRPVTQAADPKEALQRIREEIGA